MSQDTIILAFLFIELMYIVLNTIPKLSLLIDSYSKLESLLIFLEFLNILPYYCFYIDNIFFGFKDFKTIYIFLKDYLLSCLLWSKLKLLFKKLKLFIDKIIVLGIKHKVSRKIYIKLDRVDCICNYPVLENDTKIQYFIDII